MHNHGKGITEAGENADKKVFIVWISNAIIEPHAVMVKIFNTSVADSTVLAVCPAVAITVLAKKYFLELCCEGNSMGMASPLVIVNYSISGISEGCKGWTQDQYNPKGDVECKQNWIILKRQHCWKIDSDWGGNDEIGDDLSWWGRMREAIGGSFA
jgi:hypothetical protein